MSTRKRIFSFLLALIMIASLLPLDLAFAEAESDNPSVTASREIGGDTSPYTGEDEDAEDGGTIAPAEEGDPSTPPYGSAQDDGAGDEGSIAPAEPDDPDSTGSIAPAAETEATELATGSCGTNLTWRLTDDGVLTISGTGAMTSYSTSNLAPWNSYKNSITSLVVESGVTTIGNYAFYNCNQLVTASLPDSMTTLGTAAFRNCTALTNVNLPANLGNWGLSDNVFNGCSSLTQITIPSKVQYIQGYAFLNCSSLTSVSIPEGVTSIGNSAFKGCSSLTELTLPGSVNTISTSAFADCSALTEIVIPDGVEELQGTAFQNCASLARVSFGSGTKYIRGSTFKGCTSLVELRFPVSISSLGASAFEGCTGLKRIYFLGNPPTIYDTAFTGVNARANYPYFNENWTEDKLLDYGGSLTWGTWDPYYVEYDLTIAGEKVTAGSEPESNHLSGLIDNTLAYSYDPGENVLSLQGSYTVTAEDPDSLIRSGIDGLTIRMDNTVRLYAPADKDLTFLELNADTTLTSASGAYQLQINGNTGLTTGAQVADGVRLTLEDANLFFSGLTYGLVGGSGSKLDLIRSTGEIRGSWGAVRSFSGGISMQNCEITVPEAYTIGSDSSICGSNGTSAATRVCFEPYYGLVIDGVPVTDDNRSDVLSNGVFSFDGDHTLTVSGDYTGTADVLIDSNLYSLVVNVPGTAVLTNSSSASETALIRSSGDLFLSGGGYLSLKHAENAGDDSCGVLLIGANEATLSVQQCMLNVSNVARGFATSNVGQSLRLYKAEVKISSFDTAVSGFTGGVTLTDCAYVTPAYAGEKNGTVIIDSIWGDAPCANLEITGKTVYDLIVDNTRVYADNLDDIRGAGVFSFDPGTNTLHVSGVYDPETIWSGWAINKFRPVIDSSIDGLIIRVDGDTVLTSYLENYNSYTPVINSLGALTICAEGETMPVLTLAHKDDSIPFDGIHTAGALTLQNVDLQIDHCGRGLVGDGTAASSLTFDAACASIMATDGAEDAAVITGFPGGISLQNGSIYFYPGFSVVNGTLYQYGEISLGVRISTGGYNLFVDGYQISNERLSMNFGTIVYDPEANVLYLNGSGEAPVACDSLPYIENHIPGLTIHVVNAIKLPTATEATGRGIIETDVDMTIRSNNCYLALEGNGSGATGIMVKNGAKLTLDGARINILNVGYGVRGEGGAKLEVVQSWVHANDTASAGLYGFSGGLTLRETDLHTPSGGVIKSGSVFEPDGTTLAKSVELFGAVYELNIDGHWVTYENRADILGDGTFSYDPDTNTLTVSKSYSSASSATLIQNQIPGLTIALAGDVTLTNTYEDSIINLIYSTGDLTLTGGRLTLLGNGQEESCGLRLSGDDTNLTLDHTVLAVENVTFGLAGRRTGQKLTVLDASLDVSASAAALSLFDGGLSFSDGCGVIEPQNYTLNDDGTVCLGSTPAAHVVVGPLDDYSLWLGETQVTIRNKDDILGDGTASYDPSTKTLTLNNFTGVQGTHNDALIFAEIDMLTLNLVGTNTLSGSADLSTNYTLSGIDAGGKTLIIAGEGSLLIDIATGSGAAIGACDHLIMESGSLCAYAKQEPDQAFAIYGVTVKNLTINGGVLDIYGTYACMPYRSSDHFAIADDYVIMAGYRTDGKDVSACTLPEFLNLLANYPRYNYVHFAPLTAYDLWLGETQVTNANAADILGDGTASYDPETKTLTFTGELEITEAYGTYGNIYADGMDLNLVVNGDLNLSAADFGIEVLHGALIIGGTGRLAVNSNKWGIYAYGGVTVNGATVTSNAGNSDNAYHALGSAGGDININGGTITLSGPHGIWVQGSGNSIRITGGFVTADGSVDAVYWSDGTFTLGTAMQITSPVGAAIGANSIMNGTSPAKHVVIEPMASYDLWLGETQVTTLNKDDILGDGTASYDPETNTLTLNQANLRSYGVHDGSWCIVYAEMPLTIAGTGSISMINSGSVGRCAVRVAGGSVTINGDISITVSNPSVGWQSYAVLATGPVYVAGGNVSVTADGSVGFHGSSFRITGGELTVSCKTVTISSSTKMGVGLDTWDVTISGGKATFNCGSYGMIVRRTLNMTGGELNIEKGGLTSYAADMTFSGGTATINMIRSDSGTWKLTVENDARLSVNSTVKVPGGIVIGDGLAITTPAGGKIVQITPESGDPYYTITEADGTTAASHVVIEPLVAYPLWLGETQVTNANAADILGDGTASFDPETNTLTFTTETPYITGLHENALIYAENDLTLQLPESGLQLIGSADDLIYSNHGSITILGSILVGNAYGAGLRAQKNITIQGSISGTCKDLPIYTPTGSLLVTGDVKVNKTGSAGYVIYAVMGVEIQGSASVNASGSTDYLIAAENGSITLNSDFDLSNTSGYGLYAKSDITVNGSVTGTCRNRLLYAAEGSILITGDVDVTSYISASSYALYANGNIEIRGSAKIESTGVSDYGLYSGGTVTMSSGTWDIAASGTAIYAQNGIVIPATHGISLPHGGKIAQVSGHWTVTEANGATVAKHVVIEKAYFWLGEIPVTESNKDDPLQNGQASFVPATSTLTFTAETPNIPGVHEFGSNNALIYADGIDLTIEASRGLTLNNSGEGYRYGVYIHNHNVVINGSVNITGSYYAISGGNVTINGSATVEGTDYIGINCTDLTVDGDLIATGKYEGVYAYGTVNVTGDLTCTSENIGLYGRDTTVGGNMIVTGGGGEASYPYGAQINGTLNVAGNLEARGDYNGLSCGDAEIKGDLIAIGRDYIGISCGALTVEKNVVASGKYEGVYAYGTVNVTGDLTCTSEKVGFVGRDTTVGGNMKVTGGGGEVSYPYGASINGTLNVAGNLEARGDYTGLSCGDAEIKGDLIAVGRDYIGIGCTDLTVDGDLTARGKYEGVYAHGTVKTKGNVFAEATDGYMGIYGGGALVILGGRVEAKVSGSGLAKYAIFVKEGITFPSTHVISEPANAVMKTVENESAGGSAGSGVVIVDEDDQPATHVIIQPNLGDINRDGQVNVLDLMLLRKYLVELPITGETFDEAAADLNGDNVIDILDLVRMRKMLA